MKKSSGKGLDQMFVVASRRVRDYLLRPFVLLMARCGVRPWMVSLFGFGLVSYGAWVYFYGSHFFGVMMFAAGVICDAFDGPLARYMRLAGGIGKWVDSFFDTAGLVVFVGALVVLGEVGFYGGVVYMVSYVLMEFFIEFLLNENIEFYVPIRTRSWFVLFLFMKSIGWFDVLNMFIVLVGGYMALSNFYLIKKLRCAGVNN